MSPEDIMRDVTEHLRGRDNSTIIRVSLSVSSMDVTYVDGTIYRIYMNVEKVGNIGDQDYD